jgi:hypothetical protein
MAEGTEPTKRRVTYNCMTDRMDYLHIARSWVDVLLKDG